MAGSFRHVDNEGEFTFDTIDNMGDAYEVCHMMHFMIRLLGEEDEIKQAEAAYRAFLELNGCY